MKNKKILHKDNIYMNKVQSEIDSLFNTKNFVINKDLGNNIYSAINHGKPYIIKVISKDSSNNNSIIELGFIKALSLFPNSRSYINTCHDMAIGPKNIYTIYDILLGVNLGEFISHIHQSPEYINLVIQLIKHTLKSIAYTHKRGIAHRDICPDNIIVSFKNNKIETVRLINFEKSCGYFLNIANNKFETKKCNINNVNQLLTTIKDIIKIDADSAELYLSKKNDIEKLGEILWSLVNRSIYPGKAMCNVFKGHHKTMHKLHVFIVENLLKDNPTNANEILNKFVLLDKYGWEYQ